MTFRTTYLDLKIILDFRFKKTDTSVFIIYYFLNLSHTIGISKQKDYNQIKACSVFHLIHGKTLPFSAPEHVIARFLIFWALDFQLQLHYCI